jgi:hypothetical protein
VGNKLLALSPGRKSPPHTIADSLDNLETYPAFTKLCDRRAARIHDRYAVRVDYHSKEVAE